MPSPRLLPPADRPLARQTFTLQTVDLYCRLVLTACTSLQAASRVIQVVSEQFSLSLESPHPTTGRLWLLRLGYYKLQRPKTQADDWIWLVDHVIQIGTEKCLMIVGVRLCELPPPGVALRLEDLEPIAILPVTESNQEVVLINNWKKPRRRWGFPGRLWRNKRATCWGATRLYFDECQICPACKQIYWKGSHYERMARLIEQKLGDDRLLDR